MNFVLALLLFVGVYMFIGVPSNSSVAGKILDGTPAFTMGCRKATGLRISTDKK